MTNVLVVLVVALLTAGDSRESTSRTGPARQAIATSVASGPGSHASASATAARKHARSESLVFHYTNPNTTDHIRRAFVAIFIPEGVTFAADEKMENPFSDTITSRKGEPLRGSRFRQLV